MWSFFSWLCRKWAKWSFYDANARSFVAASIIWRTVPLSLKNYDLRRLWCTTITVLTAGSVINLPHLCRQLNIRSTASHDVYRRKGWVTLSNTIGHCSSTEKKRIQASERNAHWTRHRQMRPSFVLKRILWGLKKWAYRIMVIFFSAPK